MIIAKRGKTRIKTKIFWLPKRLINSECIWKWRWGRQTVVQQLVSGKWISVHWLGV